MNTNAIHNLLNLIAGALGGALVASGCSLSLTGAFDCSHSSINPVITGGAIVLIVIVKLVMNVMRDGFAGLIKPQPPVTP